MRWVHVILLIFHVKRTRASAGMTLSFNPSDRFQHEKRKFYFYFIQTFNVTFNDFSVISCLDVTGISMLILRVLPQTYDQSHYTDTGPTSSAFSILSANERTAFQKSLV